tara:strand:+ start:254 stop:568 length:315 start_codon:yes stop_codon:yes gene_type:complete
MRAAMARKPSSAQFHRLQKETRMLVANGFDDAIIGYAEPIGMSEPVVIYDRQKVIDILISQEMTEEEAIEYFDYNIAGSYMGEGTPIYMHRANREQVNEFADSR